MQSLTMFSCPVFFYTRPVWNDSVCFHVPSLTPQWFFTSLPLTEAEGTRVEIQLRIQITSLNFVTLEFVVE